MGYKRFTLEPWRLEKEKVHLEEPSRQNTIWWYSAFTGMKGYSETTQRTS